MLEVLLSIVVIGALAAACVWILGVLVKDATIYNILRAVIIFVFIVYTILTLAALFGVNTGLHMHTIG